MLFQLLLGMFVQYQGGNTYKQLQGVISGLSDGTYIKSFKSVLELLEKLREEFVEGSIGDFMDIAILIGGAGCILYISYRVWRSLANAEPIDFFPLLRPFVFAFLILSFDSIVIPTIEMVINPITIGFENIGEDDAIQLKELNRQHKEEQEKAAKAKKENEKIARQEGMNFLQKAEDTINTYLDPTYHIENIFNEWGYSALAEIESIILDLFQWLYVAAQVILKLLSTFMLIILALIGPLVFAFSCFDGFTHGFISWISRYVNISLWAPISSLLGVILNKTHIYFLQADIAAMQSTVEPTSSIWLIVCFYVVGIAGFLAVPSISSWVMEAGGVSGGIARAATASGAKIVGVAGHLIGGAGGVATGAAIKSGAQMIKGATKRFK